jgi:hypothetical protein
MRQPSKQDHDPVRLRSCGGTSQNFRAASPADVSRAGQAMCRRADTPPLVSDA